MAEHPDVIAARAILDNLLDMLADAEAAKNPTDIAHYNRAVSAAQRQLDRIIAEVGR